MSEFGILVFGHTRIKHLTAVLESLRIQGALPLVEIWLDGHQGNPALKKQCEKLFSSISHYDVGRTVRYNGHLGLRRVMINALESAVSTHDHILVLEDDCFPVRNAVCTFREELLSIAKMPDVFSVYGHHFLVEAEGEYIDRFQGWGWGVNTCKLASVLGRLKECYMMSEQEYLEFVNESLTENIITALDSTKGREATKTLRRFFAWDETVALLTAMEGMKHKKTPERTIYNFGAGDDSSHFRQVAWYRKPPFNMISLEEVWEHF